MPKKEILILNIETFILVTVWDDPFVFQGSFKITNHQDGSDKFLFFRCECYSEDKAAIQQDFTPGEYRFSHLYNEQSSILLEQANEKLDHALYLLKYALRATLVQLISRSTNHFIYADEIATSSIAKQIKRYMQLENIKDVHHHIGFSVSIEFNPKENQGKMAAFTLLNIDNFATKKLTH